MRVLSIETVAGPEVAWGEIRAGRLRLLAERKSAGPAERIFRLLAGLWEKSRPPDRICVDIGPGPFTSVRVGVALARSLAFGLSVPLAGATSLEIAAWGATGTVAAWLPAAGGKIFGAIYRRAAASLAVLRGPSCLPRQEWERRIRNNGVRLLPARPRARLLLEMAASGRLRFGDFRRVKPAYLRPSYVEERL